MKHIKKELHSRLCFVDMLSTRPAAAAAAENEFIYYPRMQKIGHIASCRLYRETLVHGCALSLPRNSPLDLFRTVNIKKETALSPEKLRFFSLWHALRPKGSPVVDTGNQIRNQSAIESSFTGLGYGAGSSYTIQYNVPVYKQDPILPSQ